MAELLGKAWLPLLVAFNHDPQSYLHPSWWGRLPQGESAAKLAGEPLARAHLNRFLGRCLDISPRPALDFDDRLRRLAVLPYEDLWKFCAVVGGCRHARVIRETIAGERRRRLERDIGREQVAQALQSRLAPVLPPEWEIGCLPESEEALAVAGVELIVAGLGSVPDEIGSRLRLKFPASWELFQRREEGGMERKSDIRGILLQMIVGRLPRWRPLFT